MARCTFFLGDSYRLCITERFARGVSQLQCSFKTLKNVQMCHHLDHICSCDPPRIHSPSSLVNHTNSLGALTRLPPPCLSQPGASSPAAAPPLRSHGPSPPHSRRFQPLLTNDPDSGALAAAKSSRALAVRPPMMPYVDMPASASPGGHPLLEPRYSEPRSGPVSKMKRLTDAEREPHSWSPAGVNEPPRMVEAAKPVLSESKR